MLTNADVKAARTVLHVFKMSMSAHRTYATRDLFERGADRAHSAKLLQAKRSIR